MKSQSKKLIHDIAKLLPWRMRQELLQKAREPITPELVEKLYFQVIEEQKTLLTSKKPKNTIKEILKGDEIDQRQEK